MNKIITQSDYTSALVSKRNDLADNIDAKGVDAERTEKLNSLVPKVLEIGGGGSSRLDETKINVMREGDPKLYTFATIADAKTFINSTDILKYVIIGSNAGVTSIGDSAFRDCTSLKSIYIPDGVNTIGNYAFWGCTSLESIIIPDSVNTIGSRAFLSCTSLTSIDLPDSITAIDSGVFYDCTSLISINIPYTVTEIGSKAFINCTSLTSIDINNDGNNSISIGDYTFANCTSLTDIHLNDAGTTVGKYAFQNCTSLKNIYLGAVLENIGEGAFENCTSLTSITDSSSIDGISIGANAFRNCMSLTSISMEYVGSIGASAFENCKSLTSISMEYADSIGTSAFLGCTSLESIIIPDSVTTIASSAFANCDILALENYKSRTGYPWGATDILIHNEDVTTTVNSSSTDRQVPTAKAVYDALSGSTVDAYTKAQTDALLDGKANLVNGKIPTSELPSYVDDVLEYASTSAFPATGESGKIYIATDTNKTYRWGGSTYAEISESLALGETSSTAYAGNKGKANADAIAAIKDGTNIDSFGDVETALADKVDKVSGKGLSTNDFTNTDKTNLTTALTKANAAAPQSTTYTKFEVDQALSAKLGFSDVDTDLSSTSTKPVQNKAVQAPIARLVDAGTKNLLKITETSQTINGVTFTVNDDGTVTVNGTAASPTSFVFNPDLELESGDYVLSGCPSGGSSTTYSLIAGDIGAWRWDYGNSVRINGTVTSASISVQQGATVNNLTFKPMICTAEDYAVSPNFVPYAKSNYELTQVTESIPRLVDGGAKNQIKLYKTFNGIPAGLNVTINEDESITIDGTATGGTGRIFIRIGTFAYKANITYKIFVDSQTDIYFYTGDLYMDSHNGQTHTYNADGEITVWFSCLFNVQYNNETIHPMICTTEDYNISPEFVPYAMSNRELTNKVNEIGIARTIIPITLSATNTYERIEASKITLTAGKILRITASCIFQKTYATGIAIVRGTTKENSKILAISESATDYNALPVSTVCSFNVDQDIYVFLKSNSTSSTKLLMVYDIISP